MIICGTLGRLVHELGLSTVRKHIMFFLSNYGPVRLTEKTADTDIDTDLL